MTNPQNKAVAMMTEYGLSKRGSVEPEDDCLDGIEAIKKAAKPSNY